jgi:hypothetical protein
LRHRVGEKKKQHHSTSIAAHAEAKVSLNINHCLYLPIEAIIHITTLSLANTQRIISANQNTEYFSITPRLSAVQTTVYIEKLLKYISGQVNAVFRDQVRYQLRGL